MSKIAEQKALEAYPIKEEWVGNQYGGLEDVNSLSREKYQEGYDQAMQDFMEKAELFFNEESTFDWQSFRNQAAKDILCSTLSGGIASGATGLMNQKENIVKGAIEITYELIKQLKEKEEKR